MYSPIPGTSRLIASVIASVIEWAEFDLTLLTNEILDYPLISSFGSLQKKHIATKRKVVVTNPRKSHNYSSFAEVLSSLASSDFSISVAF
jgi:hypothetical protein